MDPNLQRSWLEAYFVQHYLFPLVIIDSKWTTLQSSSLEMLTYLFPLNFTNFLDFASLLPAFIYQLHPNLALNFANFPKSWQLILSSCFN